MQILRACKRKLSSRAPAALPLFVVVVAVLGALTPPRALAQTLTEAWTPNGRVRATLVKNNTIYLGGDFDYVGPRTGSFAVVHPTTGRVAVTPPAVDGTVWAIAPDGAGGFYLGGEFASAGGFAVKNLAHIRADGGVDRSFAPAPNALVRALAFANGRLFVGGDFTEIAGQPRLALAQLDATGRATSWDADLEHPSAGIVTALVADARTIYIGGSFTGAAGVGTPGLVGLDTSTAAVTFIPARGAALVHSLALDAGALYAGLLGTAFDNKVVAFARDTGAVRWEVTAIGRALARGGNTLYAAGSIVAEFQGGIPVLRFAYALDAGTGTLLPWNPVMNGGANALATLGNTVYLAGSLEDAGGQPRRNLAAVDGTSGAVLGWDPVAGAPANAILATPSGVAVGGDFTSVNGMTRNFLAALDLATGRPTTFDPDLNGSVLAMADAGNTIAVVGGFTRFGGQPRDYIAEFDVATGQPTGVRFPDPGPFVSAVAADASSIYVGGSFLGLRSGTRTVRRTRLAALSRRNGSVTAFNPAANGDVLDLTVANGTIYAGGFFSVIGGRARTGLAALTPAGTVTAFNAGIDAGGIVNVVAVDGSTVYFGGNFSTVGGLARDGLAAANATSGRVSSWDPAAGNAGTEAILPAGNVVLLGGTFLQVAGQPRRWLAAVDAVSGRNLQPITPSIGPVQPDFLAQAPTGVYSIALTGDRRVVIGGAFAKVAGALHPNLAIFGF